MTKLKRDDLSDLELLDRIKDSDRLAFDILYERYWEGIYSSAYKRLCDEEICRDIVQDVFLQLWLRRDSLVIRDVSAYLYIAVRNLVFKHMYKQQRFIELSDLLNNMLADKEQSDASVLRKEFWQTYETWIRTLTTSQQEIFKMRYNDDLSTLEIADKLKITRKTVQNQLTKSVSKIRQSLGVFMIALLIESLIYKLSLFFW